MADYIKRSDAMTICEGYSQHCFETNDSRGQDVADRILDDIAEMNIADVEEVVRCKDCDVPHNKWTGCPHLNGFILPPNHYCACGTPKERGGEK